MVNINVNIISTYAMIIKPFAFSKDQESYQGKQSGRVVRSKTEAKIAPVTSFAV